MICTYTNRKVLYLVIVVLGGTVFALVLYSTHLSTRYASYIAEAERSRVDNVIGKLINADDVEVTDAFVPATFTVEATGNFTERVRQLNAQLGDIRHRTWQLRGSGDWQLNQCQPQQVLSGSRDDYLDVLAANYSHVITVTLPWLSTSSDGVWNSLGDTVNLPRQTYYEWMADDTLCTWIETPGAIKLKYDVIFRRTCVRNVSATVSARPLRPLFLNAKAINRQTYWPNNGTAYPEHFHTRPPPFVSYVHIHRDAIVTVNGDVYSGNLKLVLDACNHDTWPEIPPDVAQMPLYDELFVIAQYWGTEVFHRMCEIMPRIVLYRDFLLDNRQIKVMSPERPGGRLSELFRIIGVDDARIVVGSVRAKLVYQPRSTKCGFANVQESQTLSAVYREYIDKTLQPQPRNKLLLIRRTTSRRFTEQKKIEELMERAAGDYELTYTLFADNPTPSLNDTMMMFHSAVVIVAPVGGAEANMFFSQPGTYVVEGVCNIPHVNLCFQWLAHILGHHWQGVTSRGGCEGVVDVSAAALDDAVRSYLRLWKLERSS